MPVPQIELNRSDDIVAQELVQALTTTGFACLVGSDVWSQADSYATASRKFFEQSTAVKSVYQRPPGLTDNAGWVAVGREKLSGDRPGDYKECFNMMRYIKGNLDRSPVMLDNEDCWSLWESFSELSYHVLYLIGLGLKLKDPSQLRSTHDFSDSVTNRSALRLAWYPGMNEDTLKNLQPGQIRCGEHSDYGSITLLYTNAPGLQVVNRQTGEFEDAGYVKGGLFVNIGDLLQMWSGDVLIANKHRVLMPEREYLNNDRVSIAFFCQPDNHILIETLDGSSKYPPVTSGGWLEQKFAATYDKK